MTIADLIRCVRPVVFEGEFEEYPYMGQGTCFLARINDELFVVSASHVVGGAAAETLRIFPNDQSDVSVPLDRRCGVREGVKVEDDYADVVCFRIAKSQLTGKLGSSSWFLELNQPKRNLVAGDPLVVLGYPDESRGVNYDACIIRATGEMVGAEYVGPSVSERCRKLVLTDTGGIENMSGFSGGPVFLIKKCPDGRADISFVGMMLRANIKYGHFVESEIVRQVARRCQVTGRECR